MIIGIVLTIIAHLFLTFTFFSPYIFVVSPQDLKEKKTLKNNKQELVRLHLKALLGIAYAIMSSSVFPTIPLIIHESKLGTAFGMYACLSS